MRLLRTEWSRLFARRLTRAMLVLILLVLAAVALSVAARSHRYTAAEHARAGQRVAEQLRADERLKAECEAARRGGDALPPKYPADCVYPADPVSEQWFLPYRFDFSQELRAYLLAGAAVLAMFGFIVGASFVGAEWSSGGMANLLLWRPRRWSVLAAKLSAVLTGVGLLSMAYLAAWGGAFWLVARYRGTTGRLTPGGWQALGLTGARVLALGLVAAGVGFALASIGRHTAVAFGVAVGYVLVLDIGLAIVAGSVGVRNPDRWRLSTYVAGWLYARYSTTGDDPVDCAAGGCGPHSNVVTWQLAAAVLGAVLLAAVAAAFVSIRRRDIA
jgi:ABC-2 type transport system permease protein